MQTLFWENFGSSQSRLPLSVSSISLQVPARFHERAAALNVSGDNLYNALLANAELQPPDWRLQGRQANVWKLLSTLLRSLCLITSYLLLPLDYIPHDIVDTGGANSKQVSRTLEVSTTIFCFVGSSLNHDYLSVLGH